MTLCVCFTTIKATIYAKYNYDSLTVFCFCLQTVHQCDFINITIQPSLQDETALHGFLCKLPLVVNSLPEESFDVVLFSLLLEYLPSPEPRWLCCNNAHKLLKLNGLLLIITPDSKHVNHNAHQMKSWKMAIEFIGFRRWRYVKLKHLHCMAFRKTQTKKPYCSKCNSSDLVKNNWRDMLYIPQDSNTADLN